MAVAVAVAVAMVPMDLRMRVLVPYVFLPHFLGFSTLVWAWQRGDRFAPRLILGFMPVALAWACVSARNMGWLPVGFLTTRATQIGVAIELPIVILILMLRSQQHRESRRSILGLDRVDSAIGLINGFGFARRMMRIMTRSERLKQQSAVMLIDIVSTDQIGRDYDHKNA